MLADLDSEDFETRDKASKGLKTLGKLCEPRTTQAFGRQPVAEVKRQVEEILTEIGRQTQSAEMLRLGRALRGAGVDRHTGGAQGVETLAKEARGQWLRDVATPSLKTPCALKAQGRPSLAL